MKEKKHDIRVLVCTTTFPRWKDDPGPAFIYNHSQKLLENNVSVVILAPYHKAARKFEIFNGLRVYRFRYFPFQKESLTYEGGGLLRLKQRKWNYLQIPFFIICQFFAIVRLVKKENIDVIQAHWVLPQGFVAALYKKLVNKEIKVVCTSHGSDLLGIKNKVLNSFKRFTLRNVDYLSVVSHHLKTEAQKILPETHVSVLPMGVDTQRFCPKKDFLDIKSELSVSGPMLLFIGRLSPEKGIEELLRIMPQIIQQHPNSKLVVIGSGVLKDRLLSLCEELRVKDNIIFIDHVDNKLLPDYYLSADIVVGPSHYEGFGIVFAEAIACGCCVVAYELPGLKEVVINNETGFTVPAQNEKALAEKIIHLLKHPQDMERIKQKGREYMVDHFDAAKLTKKYVDLYRS